MTAATKKTTVNAIHCKLKGEGCKGRFRPTRSTQKYCEVCSKQAGNAKRKAPYKIPTSNHFFIQLARAAETAGTLEVFKHLKGDVQALMALYHVVCFRMKANLAAENNDAYHMSHIAPANGVEVIGAFHPANVVITTGERNKRHGVQHFNDAGLFIDRDDAKRAYKLKGDEKWSDLIDMIITFIGEKTVTEFASACKLKESTKAQLKKKLAVKLETNSNIPNHAQHTRTLNNPKSTVVDLSNAIAEIENKSVWKLTSTKYNESAVAVLELARHSQYRPELQQLSDLVTELCQDMDQYKSYGFVKASLEDDKLDLIFDLLHGEEVGCEVDEWIAELTEIVGVRRARMAAAMAARTAKLAPVVQDDAPVMTDAEIMAHLAELSDPDYTPF